MKNRNGKNNRAIKAFLIAAPTFVVVFFIAVVLLSNAGYLQKTVDKIEKPAPNAFIQQAETQEESEIPTEIENEYTAMDYLPNSTYTIFKLKEYFKRQGYSFDDWYVAQDDSDAYIELKTGTGGTVINYKTNSYMINLGNTAVGPNTVMWTTGSNASVNIMISTEYGDSFEVLEMLLSTCPESLKPNMSELKRVDDLPLNGSGASDYLDVKEAGTYYRINRIVNGYTTNYMISVYKNAPGGWNGN